VTQEELGEEEDERFSELAVHLPSQNVEEVCGRGQICYLHVAVLVLALELL